MSENETEDHEQSEVAEPAAEADATEADATEAGDEEAGDEDVEGHIFGAALRPGALRANTAGTPDFKGVVTDLNAYTLYGGLGSLPGEVSRPTRDQ